MKHSGELPQLSALVHQVKDRGPAMTRLTSAELARWRYALSDRRGRGELPELLMPDAFGAVAEVVRRTTGHSYADAEIMAGAALYSGHSVQSEDNGRNHVIALLPAYLCAVFHESV